MKIEVHKYGGTSVSSIEKINNIAKRTLAYQQKKLVKVILVLSAMGKDTDRLNTFAYDLNDEPDLMALDVLLSCGEKISCSLMVMALKNLNVEARIVDGKEARIETNSCFGHADIVNVNTDFLKNLIANNVMPVVTGFQGVDFSGNITTLGRGGSDLSAIVLANSLNADCYIYTDVDGVYNIDPAVFAQAKKIFNISALSMLCLAKSGAKVLHPKAAEQIYQNNVNTWIKPAHDWQNQGTKIISNYIDKDLPIAITCDQEIIELTVALSNKLESVRSLLDSLAKNSYSLDIIGGYDIACGNAWRIFVSQNELRWCLNFLKTNKCDFKIGDKYIKYSLLNLNSNIDSAFFDKAYEFLVSINVDLKNLITQKNCLTVFLTKQINVDKLIADNFEHLSYIN